MAQRSLAIVVAAATALVLSACAAPPPPAPPVLLPPAPPAPPPKVAASPAPAPPPPQARVPSPSDSCGAESLKYLVGRPEADIPPPIDPGRRRVLCSRCVISPEHEPWRQTIIFSSTTGLVTSVTCG